MSKDKILILTQRALHNGPRMIREVNAFINDFDIDITGTSTPHTDRVNYIPFHNIERSFINKVLTKLSREAGISLPLWLTNSRFLNKLTALLKANHYKVIITHNPIWLPVLKKLQEKFDFKIVYNAHEYHPLEFTDNPKWLKTWGRVYTNIYKNDLPTANLVVNVCDSIAVKCKEEFGVDSLVVPNVSDYNDCVPSPMGENIRIIHHGSTVLGRNLEGMIKVAELLGHGYDVYFMLNVSDQNYFSKLKKMAAAAPNIKFVEAVPFDQIINEINKYDIGLYVLPPTNYNNEIALPNKIFEFIQAKLCLAFGPSIEMKNVILKNNVGVVSNDFTSEAMAAKIKSLSRTEIEQYKKNSDEVAKTLNTDSVYKMYRENLLLLLKK